MTVDVVCPACESGYVLDESSAGDDFVCPSCSHRSMIGAPAPEPTAADPPAVAARPDSSDTPSPRYEIVCPRCQLHFEPEKHSVELHPGDRSTILIVEEEGYSRDATAEALAQQYDVVTAGTVDAGARILSLGGIDLMILDLDIDQGFGRQLLRHGVMKTCPVIIYGHDESEFYGEAWDSSKQQGADDMVIKGMNAAEALVRKVGALLGKRVEEDAM